MCCKYTNIRAYICISNDNNDVRNALLLQLISIAVSATDRKWFINLCIAAPQCTHNHLQLTIVIIYYPLYSTFFSYSTWVCKNAKYVHMCAPNPEPTGTNIYLYRVALHFLWQQYT